jgi:hypothetical protein
MNKVRKKKEKSLINFETYMLMASIGRLSECKRQKLIDMLNESLDDGDYIAISEHSNRIRKLFAVTDTEFKLAEKQARTQVEIKNEIRCN